MCCLPLKSSIHCGWIAAFLIKSHSIDCRVHIMQLFADIAHKGIVSPISNTKPKPKRIICNQSMSADIIQPIYKWPFWCAMHTNSLEFVLMPFMCIEMSMHSLSKKIKFEYRFDLVECLIDRITFYKIQFIYCIVIIHVRFVCLYFAKSNEYAATNRNMIWYLLLHIM